MVLFLFGLLQGLTEFLPVSSSGHLSMLQYFSSEFSENLSLNIAVHMGTLLTIVIYYRKDIFEMITGFVRRDRESVSMVMMILVASVPTAVIGLFMKKNLDWVLTNPLVAACCLLVTGTFLFFSDRIEVRSNYQEGFGMGYLQAFLIGLVQGLAVLPGISRSGSTIIAGLYLGMSAKNSARFSFLISLPAILGAGLLEFIGMESSVDLVPLLVGAVVAFLSGLFAIAWMVRLTLNGNLKFFSYYLFILSASFLTCYFLGWGQGIL